MVKTSTSLNSVNHPASQPIEVMKNQDELFYESIKPQLNELIKDPSDECIERILAYAKEK